MSHGDESQWFVIVVWWCGVVYCLLGYFLQFPAQQQSMSFMSLKEMTVQLTWTWRPLTGFLALAFSAQTAESLCHTTAVQFGPWCGLLLYAAHAGQHAASRSGPASDHARQQAT